MKRVFFTRGTSGFQPRPPMPSASQLILRRKKPPGSDRAIRAMGAGGSVSMPKEMPSDAQIQEGLGGWEVRGRSNHHWDTSDENGDLLITVTDAKKTIQRDTTATIALTAGFCGAKPESHVMRKYVRGHTWWQNVATMELRQIIVSQHEGAPKLLISNLNITFF